jgi:nitrite reductase (NADH) small subunit
MLTLMVQKEQMPLIKVGPLQQLPPGSSIHVEVGDDAVAVCNVGGTLYAMDGICPHSSGPLGYGALDGAILSCPFHGWEFDCRTGAFGGNEDLKLATYPVKVEDGEILVELA